MSKVKVKLVYNKHEFCSYHTLSVRPGSELICAEPQQVENRYLGVFRTHCHNPLLLPVYFVKTQPFMKLQLCQHLVSSTGATPIPLYYKNKDQHDPRHDISVVPNDSPYIYSTYFAVLWTFKVENLFIVKKWGMLCKIANFYTRKVFAPLATKKNTDASTRLVYSILTRSLYNRSVF